MKTLVFDGTQEKDQDAFQILYQGFLLGTPQGGLVGIKAHRDAVKILDKFEDISDEVVIDGNVVRMQGGDPMRNVHEEENVVLELEDSQFEMVERHFNNVPWKIGVSRIVIDVADKLEQAKKQNGE